MSATNKSAAKGCGMLVLAVVGTIFFVAVLSGLINFVFGIDPNRKPEVETKAQPPAVVQEIAVAPDKTEFETRTPKPGEIQTLAEETLAFIDRAHQTIGYAIQASDGQAIRDDVEMPSWQMMKRWMEFSYKDYAAYEACYDALASMNSYAASLTAADSADRRRSLDYNTKRMDKYLPKCKKTVDSKGRIRSDE